MGNWIRLTRGIRNHWVWQDKEKFQWWVDLLMMASWSVEHTVVRSQRIVLQRGQLTSSGPYLAQRWGVNRKTVVRFLDMLESDGMITRHTVSHNIGIVTICNYDKYQTPVDNLADNLADNPLDNLLDTNKEIKEGNKKGEGERARVSSSVMARPTTSEVRAYALEIGRGEGEAEAFVDYYTGNGWRVGRTPMKDWRATFRNWVRRSFTRSPSTPPGMVLTAERRDYKGW